MSKNPFGKYNVTINGKTETVVDDFDKCFFSLLGVGHYHALPQQTGDSVTIEVRIERVGTDTGAKSFLCPKCRVKVKRETYNTMEFTKEMQAKVCTPTSPAPPSEHDLAYQQLAELGLFI